jgi:hypothetical protein
MRMSRRPAAVLIGAAVLFPLAASAIAQEEVLPKAFIDGEGPGWRELFEPDFVSSGGNSGVFVWASEEALTDLKPGSLPPGGIEVQVLDHGYAEQFEQRTGQKPDWFTTNGDVFPVGTSTMTPFEPHAPNGQRSFPRKNLSKGVNEWNHYYVRAINGEVRLWVNGEEVSGGTDCEPRSGFLCLESEGAPVEFKHVRIRELP